MSTAPLGTSDAAAADARQPDPVEEARVQLTAPVEEDWSKAKRLGGFIASLQRSPC